LINFFISSSDLLYLIRVSMTKNCYHSFLISTPSYKKLIINITFFRFIINCNRFSIKKIKKVLKIRLKLKWLMKFTKFSWWIKSNGLWHDL
jgi:hypothetical protein